MNNKRRELIKCNISMLENIKTNIEGILSDEEMNFDNMPENLQSSIRGEESESAIEILNEVIEDLDICINSLTEIV